MGKPERKARDKLCSSSSYLLRCFGISRKIHSDNQMVDDRQEKTKTKTKMRTSWFSRPSKFRLKNGGEVAPAPIYEREKQNSSVEDALFRKTIATFEPETNQKITNEARDINPDPLSFSGRDTCNEQVSTTEVRGGKHDPSKIVGSDGSKPKDKRSSRVKRGSRVDPVIGVSIILVTLMIMLMWGRLCAILCTCVWCYFLPRLKEAAAAKRKRSYGGSKVESGLFPIPGDMDLYSKAYKKKVVLEGFLFRQHRVSL